MSSIDHVTFGDFRLDLHNQCLWDNERAIALRPKAFAVLKLLVENPGQLVTKQQLLETVWSGTFVTDAVLKDSIRQLRDALRDQAAAPSYIETSHRRGYRFIAKVGQSLTTRDLTSVIPSALPRAPLPTPMNTRRTPVFGRSAELDRLRAAFDRAVAGERQLIFVSGEAGIGKTTVVEALLDQNGDIPGIRIARGQCLEHFGSSEPYMPVLEAMSRLTRADSKGSVIDTLRRHAPAWLAQMPSLVSPDRREPADALSAATRERMLREMSETLEVLAASHPFVLFIDDLHWSDYSTLDLISYLARRRDGAKLMVIATYRPVEVILRDHPLKPVKRELQAQGLCSEIALEYLTEDAIREYLSAQLAGSHFPARLPRLIHERTEGNPLFMVNAIDYLTSEKLIVEEHGVWKLSADFASFAHAVPNNVKALIEKQIERLTPDERMVLESASVSGMDCSTVSIAAGLDKPVEWVDAQCEQLAGRHHFLSSGRIVELPDGTITPRYTFNHVLYLEVPYALIPPMRRAQIHQRIAVRGMEIYRERANEIAAELAMHFEQSRDWAQAVRYLIVAADNATRRSAHHESSALARRGLELLKLLPDTPERVQQEIKLRMILGAALMVIKGFACEEVEDVFSGGRTLFWSQGPSPELFHMLWSLGLYYQYGSKTRASLQIAEQLLELAESMGDGALIMEAHRSLGGALVILGRCAEALPHLDRSAALHATHGRHAFSTLIGRDCKVMSDSFAALALWSLDRADEAEQRMAQGMALARELRHPESLIVALHFSANLHILQNAVELVQRPAQEAKELAEEYGYQLWLAYSLIELGWAEAELGREEGIASIKAGLAAYEETGAMLWMPHFLGLTAAQLARYERPEEGLETIAKAFTCAEQSGECFSFPELYRIKGELLLQRDQMSAPPRRSTKTPPSHDEARACFAEALAVAEQQNANAWAKRARTSMDHLPR